MIPCVLFEDEHLLVVDKPAGVNTHAPSPFAGEGIYDWLRHREPRWASLAILHRLDKETSGVMVFGRTPLANRSLTEQFASRGVGKRYLLVSDRPVKRSEFTVKSAIRRVGERYASGAGGAPAETHFRVVPTGPGALSALSASPLTLLEAEPRTGRTHQIRVHAAESGLPILGDTLYGGSPAPRVFLHAAELHFNHPATGIPRSFTAPGEFGGETSSTLAHERTRTATDAPVTTVVPDWISEGFITRRLAFIDLAETNAFRLIHGAGDGWPGWNVEQLGAYLLSQGERPLTTAQTRKLDEMLRLTNTRGAYHKLLNRQVRRTHASDVSPQCVLGAAAPDRFEIRENGVRFEMSFAEGYSVGLFLDQRDNRRRFLAGHVAADFPLFPSSGRAADGALQPRREILNTFAYTCGFSVAAAAGGARTTSLDLSRKYLEWGRRNFLLNGLDPAQHDFIFGDTFDWLRRLARKGRAFDVVVLDPPTFSQSKETGLFRAEKDYGRLVRAALPVLKRGGVLLASANTADWPPEEFVQQVRASITASGRKVAQDHFVPQPVDFPITRAEPGYLKTLWLRVD